MYNKLNNDLSDIYQQRTDNDDNDEQFDTIKLK